MKVILMKTIHVVGLILTSQLLLGSSVSHAEGAEGPHAVVMTCSSFKSPDTNLMTLYVQGLSTDDHHVNLAVGKLTQPPSGIECGVALAKVLSICEILKERGGCELESPKEKGGRELESKSKSKYTIQSVIPVESSWIYTLTAP